jgi:hypothetical protein
VSGDYLVFGRGPREYQITSHVILYTFSTQQFEVIAEAQVASFQTDQVAGDYVVYTRIAGSSADVYRFQISTGQRLRIPAAPRRPGEL